MNRRWVLLGALSAAAAVGAGAFGAHGLQAALTAERLAVWDTAARYQLIHAVALVALGALAAHRHRGGLQAVGWLFVAGTVLFCGSLYLLALGGTRSLGVVAPVGGAAFIVGWLYLAWVAWRNA